MRPYSKIKKHLDCFRFGHGSVSMTRGTEGPQHDPYGWEELEIVYKGNTILIRSSGLASLAEFPGFMFHETDYDTFTEFWQSVNKATKALTGRTADEWHHVWELAYRKLHVEDPMGCLSDYE